MSDNRKVSNDRINTAVAPEASRLDALEIAVVKGFEGQKASTRGNGGESGLHPLELSHNAAEKSQGTRDLSAERRQVQATLGTPEKLSETQLKEVTLILVTAKKDLSSPKDVQTAIELSRHLDRIRADLSAPRLNLQAALELDRMHKTYNISHKDAAAALAVQHIFNHKTSDESLRLIKSGGITFEELNGYSKQIGEGRLTEANVRQLLQADKETRPRMLADIERQRGDRVAGATKTEPATLLDRLSDASGSPKGEAKPGEATRQIYDATGKPVALDKVVGTQPVTAVTFEAGVARYESYQSADDLRHGKPATNTTEIALNEKSSEFTVKTTDAAKHTEICRFDEEGKVTGYEISTPEHKLNFQMVDGHPKSVTADGRELPPAKAAALLEAAEMAIQIARQKIQLPETQQDPFENLRPTPPREGASATNTPTGTLVWNDGHGLQQARVENGAIKGEDGTTIGRVNDIGQVQLNGQPPFTVKESEGAAFHGIGGDGNRLDLVSESSKGRMNGELVSADNKERLPVIGGNIYDSTGKFLGALGEDGDVALAHPKDSRVSINAFRDGATFEGEEGGKKRIFTTSAETASGSVHLPVDGKPVEFDVRMGMLIDKKTGEQAGWITPPREQADGKLQGGVLARITPDGIQEIPLAAIKNATFELTLMGQSGVEGKPISGISLGARTQADGTLAPGQGFLNVSEVVSLEQTRARAASGAIFDLRDRGTYTDWRYLTGLQDADVNEQKRIREASSANIREFERAVKTGQVDDNTVARLQKMKESTEASMSSRLQVDRRKLDEAKPNLEKLPDDVRTINGTVTVKTSSGAQTWSIKEGVIHDAQGQELGRIVGPDGRLELKNNERLRSIFSAEAAGELAKRPADQPLHIDMKMLTGARWQMEVPGYPSKIDWISLGQAGIASRGDLLSRAIGEVGYAGKVDNEAKSNESAKAHDETRARFVAYEKRLAATFSQGPASAADVKFLSESPAASIRATDKPAEAQASSKIELVPLNSEDKLKTVQGKLRIGDDYYDIRNGDLYKHTQVNGKDQVETTACGSLKPGYNVSFKTAGADGKEQNERTISLAEQNRVLMEFTVGGDHQRHRVLGLGASKRTENQGFVTGGLVDVQELNRQASANLKRAIDGDNDYVRNTPYATGAIGDQLLGNRGDLLHRFVDDIGRDARKMGQNLTQLFEDGLRPGTLGTESFNNSLRLTQSFMNSMNITASDTQQLSERGQQLQSQINDGITIAAITVGTAGLGTAFSGLANSSKIIALGRMGRVGMFAGEVFAGSMVGGTTSMVLRASDNSSAVNNFKAGAIEGGLMTLGSMGGRAMGTGTTIKEARALMAMEQGAMTAEKQQLLLALQNSVTGRLLQSSRVYSAHLARLGYEVGNAGVQSYGFSAAGSIRQGKAATDGFNDAGVPLGIATNLLGGALGRNLSGLMRTGLAREMVENAFSSGTSGVLDGLKPQLDMQDARTAERLGIPLHMLSEATKHKHRNYGAVLENALETGAISAISAPFTSMATHGVTRLVNGRTEGNGRHPDSPGGTGLEGPTTERPSTERPTTTTTTTGTERPNHVLDRSPARIGAAAMALFGAVGVDRPVAAPGAPTSTIDQTSTHPSTSPTGDTTGTAGNTTRPNSVADRPTPRMEQVVPEPVEPRSERPEHPDSPKPSGDGHKPGDVGGTVGADEAERRSALARPAADAAPHPIDRPDSRKQSTEEEAALRTQAHLTARDRSEIKDLLSTISDTTERAKTLEHFLKLDAKQQQDVLADLSCRTTDERVARLRERCGLGDAPTATRKNDGTHEREIEKFWHSLDSQLSTLDPHVRAELAKNFEQAVKSGNWTANDIAVLSDFVRSGNLSVELLHKALQGEQNQIILRDVCTSGRTSIESRNGLQDGINSSGSVVLADIKALRESVGTLPEFKSEKLNKEIDSLHEELKKAPEPIPEALKERMQAVAQYLCELQKYLSESPGRERLTEHQHRLEENVALLRRQARALGMDADNDTIANSTKMQLTTDKQDLERSIDTLEKQLRASGAFNKKGAIVPDPIDLAATLAATPPGEAHDGLARLVELRKQLILNSTKLQVLENLVVTQAASKGIDGALSIVHWDEHRRQLMEATANGSATDADLRRVAGSFILNDKKSMKPLRQFLDDISTAERSNADRQRLIESRERQLFQRISELRTRYGMLEPGSENSVMRWTDNGTALEWRFTAQNGTVTDIKVPRVPDHPSRESVDPSDPSKVRPPRYSEGGGGQPIGHDIVIPILGSDGVASTVTIPARARARVSVPDNERVDVGGDEPGLVFYDPTPIKTENGMTAYREYRVMPTRGYDQHQVAYPNGYVKVSDVYVASDNEIVHRVHLGADGKPVYGFDGSKFGFDRSNQAQGEKELGYIYNGKLYPNGAAVERASKGKLNKNQVDEELRIQRQLVRAYHSVTHFNIVPNHPRPAAGDAVPPQN